MIQQKTETIRENPVLRMEHAAVCLHYIETDCPVDSFKEPCRVFYSMEADLLAYQFQIDPLFYSRCETEKQSIEIIYPESLIYESENRRTELRCQDRIQNANVFVSSTIFPNSKIKVWHVTISPQTKFSEYDIIKLIHLYDGRSENTNMLQLVQFRLSAGEAFPASCLLSNLVPINTDTIKLTAGTIEIIVKDMGSDAESHINIMETVRRARKDDDKEAAKIIERWMNNKENIVGKTLKAYCGIVTGIFDFAEIDDEEVMDTLKPTFADSNVLYRIHRCTLICIANDDRAMKECANTVGISPYLLIPHAAILHNETLVSMANEKIKKVKKFTDLKTLVKAREEAEHYLKNLYLPNVFNYITEQTLFRSGNKGRGSIEKLNATNNKITELNDKISSLWEKRRDAGQLFITVILNLLTIIGLKNVYYDIFNPIVHNKIILWLIFGLIAAFIEILIVCFWKLRLPK